MAAATALLLAAAFGPSRAKAASQPPNLSEVVAEFQRYSGAKLVFERSGLPNHTWYDRMPALSSQRKLDAASIALEEVQRLPRGYLGAVGLRTIGIFEACISKTGDGYRPYNKRLKGYLYYGLYQSSALVAAYYTDQQLPLTLHHEIFHHVDSTRAGKTKYRQNFHADDARFAQAVALKNKYPALVLAPGDKAALGKASGGSILYKAVGNYANKSVGEDQAETARYVMSHLPDAILQAATMPQLAGTQRILHILRRYEAAAATTSQARPGTFWFVAASTGHDPYLQELKLAMVSGRSEAVRAAKDRSRQFGRTSVALTKADARATLWLIQKRVTRDGKGAFAIYGSEDANGVNWTLRADLASHGKQLASLAKLASTSRGGVRTYALTQLLSGVGLIARFHNWTARKWTMTKGTRVAFEGSVRHAAEGLSAREHRSLRDRLKSASMSELGSIVGKRGELKRWSLKKPANKYMANVDKTITSGSLRAAIRRAQPAAVRISTGGSGVNIHPSGVVLTAGHVLKRVGRRARITFPDGRSFMARCTFYDARLDVAIARIETTGLTLPTAPIAKAAPTVGTTVVVIGQPGGFTPGGEATGYGAFHVSVGRIRGFLPNRRLGNQSLGRTKHDAWTYWGHSGSPLFNSAGEIVAMHNSWDSKTAMRHAVTWEAITHDLKRWKVPHRTGL